MSKYGEEEPKAGKALLERDLAESVLAARQSLNQVYRERQHRGTASEQALLDLDTATWHAYYGLRPYMQKYLNDKWGSYLLTTYNDKEVIFGSRCHIEKHKQDPLETLRELFEKNLDDATRIHGIDDTKREILETAWSIIARDQVMYVDEFRNLTETYSEETPSEHGHGWTTETVEQPVYLSPRTYEEVIELMMQTLREAEFAPTGKMPEYTATEVLE